MTRKRSYTLEEIERRQKKAITGARNLGLDDVADRIEEMTASEYAEDKNLMIENRRTKGGDKHMTSRNRQALLDEINELREENDELRDRAESAEEKLDAINAITTEPEAGEVEEDDSDDD